MNKSIIINMLAGIIAVVSLTGVAADESGMEEDLGYFFGYSFGNMLKQSGAADVDIDALRKGLMDSLADQAPGLAPGKQEAIREEIRRRQLAMESARQEAALVQGTANLDAANEFLKHNLSQPGVEVTSTGLQYKAIEDKKGENATAGSSVSVHYKGRLIDGTVFDATQSEPVTFALSQVIPGWTEGLQLMSPGDKFEFYIHPELAYGAGGVGSIPPNSLLIFEVELLEVK